MIKKGLRSQVKGELEMLLLVVVLEQSTQENFQM